MNDIERCQKRFARWAKSIEALHRELRRLARLQPHRRDWRTRNSLTANHEAARQKALSAWARLTADEKEQIERPPALDLRPQLIAELAKLTTSHDRGRGTAIQRGGRH